MKTEIAKSVIGKSSQKQLRRFLLICGILSSVLYIIMNIVAPIYYSGYDLFSQTVSELSAIDSPTRSLWVPLGIVYTLLVAAFGWAVRQSAGRSHSLWVAGTLLLVYGVIGLGWPPMHQREVLAAGGETLTDTMHIAYSMVTVLLMLLSIWFASRSLGKSFRFYSVTSIITLIILGTWTGMEAPKLQLSLPTPWLGVIERILILIFLVWIVVLAILLLRNKKNNSKIFEEKGIKHTEMAPQDW
jgi:hypothetical protein